MTQDVAWLAWIGGLAAALTALGVTFWRLERLGLVRDKGTLTLSVTLRRWLGIRPPRGRAVWAVPTFVAGVGGAAAGLMLLIVHIVL